MQLSQLIGLIFLIIGGLQVIRPDIFVRFQIWTQRVIMAAKYEPSQRTHQIVRFMGIPFVLLGLLLVILPFIY